MAIVCHLISGLFDAVLTLASNRSPGHSQDKDEPVVKAALWC